MLLLWTTSMIWSNESQEVLGIEQHCNIEPNDWKCFWNAIIPDTVERNFDKIKLTLVVSKTILVHAFSGDMWAFRNEDQIFSFIVVGKCLIDDTLKYFGLQVSKYEITMVISLVDFHENETWVI